MSCTCKQPIGFIKSGANRTLPGVRSRKPPRYTLQDMWCTFEGNIFKTAREGGFGTTCMAIFGSWLAVRVPLYTIVIYVSPVNMRRILMDARIKQEQSVTIMRFVDTRQVKCICRHVSPFGTCPGLFRKYICNSDCFQGPYACTSTLACYISHPLLRR